MFVLCACSRRERGSSRSKSSIPDHDVYSRRRRRDNVQSAGSSGSVVSAEDVQYITMSLTPPTTPKTRIAPDYGSGSTEVLLASLELPVQLSSSSAIHTLNLTSDLSDIPYMVSGERKLFLACNI